MSQSRLMVDELKRELIVIATRLLRDRDIFRELEETYALLEPYLARDPHLTVEVGRALLARARATLH